MRTRTALSLSTIALLGLCVWVYLALERIGEAPNPEVALRALEAQRAARAAQRLEGEAGDSASAVLEGAEVLVLDGARKERSPGYLVSDPDSLVRVSGRVLDAETREPLAGIRLRLMSRRPQTSSILTDADGRFQTGAVLAPGVVSVVHVPDDEAPRYCVRWEIEPGEFLATDPALEPEAREVVLCAQSPERVLEVNIHTPDGSSPAGASVTLTFGRRDAAGEFVSEGRDYEVCDANGRVRFAQFGEGIFDRSFRIEAEHRGVLASDVVSLDPPIGTRPLELDLHPGGILRVHAKNDEGRPIANLSLWVSNNESGRTARGHNGDTDAHGDCLFAPLRPGCYSVNAVHPLTGETLQREIDIARGAQASVDLRLSLANLRLGLSGAVLDEVGYPLPGISVRIQAPGESPVELTTSEGGRFEYWGRPTAGLFFSIGTGFMDDEYEPATLAVPFGTTNLGVRRVKRLETQTLAFAVVDKHSGAPVRRASIVLFHAAGVGDGGTDPGHALPSQKRFGAQAGVAEVTFKLRADSGFAVDAPGYVRAQGSLRALCEDYAHSAALRVELAPGFERRIEVRDRISKRTLTGARLFEERRLAGTSDASGAVEVSLPEWPANFRVECPGYQLALWDPLAAGFPGNVIWLDPQRPGQ